MTYWTTSGKRNHPAIFNRLYMDLSDPVLSGLTDQELEM